MKIVMILDQIQSGLGSKDDRMRGLGILKEPVGPAVMMEPYLKRVDARVMATLYCGDGTYEANPDEVARKLVAMVGKLAPDLVICGPAFNYLGYAEMCGRVAADIRRTASLPAIAAMAEEAHETIERYRGLVPIVRTPRKGGVGLNDALRNMCLLARAIVDRTDASELERDICF